jgi:hypothetical protein
MSGADVRQSGDQSGQFVERGGAMNAGGSECMVVRLVVPARHPPPSCPISHSPDIMAQIRAGKRAFGLLQQCRRR